MPKFSCWTHIENALSTITLYRFWQTTEKSVYISVASVVPLCCKYFRIIIFALFNASLNKVNITFLMQLLINPAWFFPHLFVLCKVHFLLVCSHFYWHIHIHHRIYKIHALNLSTSIKSITNSRWTIQIFFKRWFTMSLYSKENWYFMFDMQKLEFGDNITLKDIQIIK